MRFVVNRVDCLGQSDILGLYCSILGGKDSWN